MADAALNNTIAEAVPEFSFCDTSWIDNVGVGSSSKIVIVAALEEIDAFVGPDNVTVNASLSSSSVSFINGIVTV